MKVIGESDIRIVDGSYTDCMESPRIRMDTSSLGDTSPHRVGPRPLTLVVTFAMVVLLFGLVTARFGGQGTIIDSPMLTEPVVEPGFITVAELEASPWEPFRVSGGYLFRAEDGSLAAITDEDEFLWVGLTGLRTLFGAIAGNDESIAYGMSNLGPAIWRSTDLKTWTMERLPWEGTVLAAMADDSGTRLIGIQANGSEFSYVLATDTKGVWQVNAAPDTPDTGIAPAPGGFVGRGRATDGGGYGYLFSTDGLEWTYQSLRGVGVNRNGGQVPSFVIEEGGPAMLRLPGDDRTFTPPGWPISSIWVEAETFWIQTIGDAWSSSDLVEWARYPIGRETGVDNGFSMLIPVGDQPRIANSFEGQVDLLRWDTGSGPAS